MLTTITDGLSRSRGHALAAATLLLLNGVASNAWSQIVPERLYHGVDRAIPMTVARPDGAAGELNVLLLSPGPEKDGSDVIKSAPVKEGAINLASLFPEIWTTKPARLMYAQLAVGEDRVGPAVVIQPTDGPRYARLRDNDVEWVPQPDRILSGVRTYVEKYAVVETTAGVIEFAMRPDAAPNTVANFLHLVDGGFYTDILIHRIVPKRPDGAPFVIQFGDPTGTGMGGPGYFVDLERSGLQHDYGVLSMARSPDPNSNGSQVFVCLSREGTMVLDGKYTAFAQAVSGTEAITALTASAVDANGRPTMDPPPKVKSVTLRDAPPRGKGPRPITRPLTEVKEPAAR